MAEGDEDATVLMIKNRLIELMRDHSYMYDKSHEDFKDRQKKINTWARFAEELEVAGEFSFFLLKHMYLFNTIPSNRWWVILVTLNLNSAMVEG